MKPLIASILTLLAAPALFADVAIYSGSAVTKTTSADGTSTKVARMIEILDLASGNSQAVILAKEGHVRTFTVEAPLASTLTTVTDSRNKKTTAVVAFAATTTDVTTNVTSTASVLLKGAIGSWKIKDDEQSDDSSFHKHTAPKTDVPHQFQGVSSLVSTSGVDPTDSSAIAAALVISTPVLNLDCKLSATANNAGHLTVDAALADVKAALLAAGYTEKP